MKKTPSLDAVRKRYRRLADRLAKAGLIAQGTIVVRTLVRDDPKTGGKKKRYGPYYQWTWKHKGKTVTVNLTAEQARAYQNAIDNNRRIEAILQEMRSLSRLLLDASAPGVKKRKRKQDNQLRLS